MLLVALALTFRARGENPTKYWGWQAFGDKFGLFFWGLFTAAQLAQGSHTASWTQFGADWAIAAILFTIAARPGWNQCWKAWEIWDQWAILRSIFRAMHWVPMLGYIGWRTGTDQETVMWVAISSCLSFAYCMRYNDELRQDLGFKHDESARWCFGELWIGFTLALHQWIMI